MFYYFNQYLNNVRTILKWKSSISEDSGFLVRVQSKKITKKKIQVFNDFLCLLLLNIFEKDSYWIFLKKIHMKVMSQTLINMTI